MLRFPGRPLKDLAGIPSRVLTAIADQVQVPASAFARYGDRDNTVYEHLDEIRRTYQFRECGWREYLWLARELLPQATESDRPVPLIEQALELLRAEGIIAPALTHLERLVWIVLKAAEKRLFRLLTADLTLEHRARLDGLLYAEGGRRGTTRLSWLREPPGVTSAKSVKQIVERLLFLRGLGLPAIPPALHQNRVLQLARKWDSARIRTKMGHFAGWSPSRLSCFLRRFVAFLSLLLDRFWLKGHLVGQRFRATCPIHVIEPNLRRAKTNAKQCGTARLDG